MPLPFSRDGLGAACLVLALMALTTNTASAQTGCVSNGCVSDCNGNGDEPCSYGPCPCQPRGTLFQWSYGTSFSGGPPGPDEPLASDRPDFTEASVTVGRGVAQLEFGYTYTYDREGDDSSRSHSLPETLLRVGVLAEWLELRVVWNYVEESAVTGGARTFATGAEDLGLGFKFALTPQEGILPEMALITQMSVPTGTGELSDNEVLPGISWLYSWEVNDFVSVGGTTLANRAIDEGTGEAYTELAQSATAAYSLSEQLGAYTEWFALIPHSADTARTEHYFNGGFTFLVTNDVQLDVRAGVGLNRHADDYFIGSGAVVRF